MHIIFNISLMHRNLTEAQKASKYQVGNYRVFLDNFEAVALPTLDSDTVRVRRLSIKSEPGCKNPTALINASLQDILFVDEIGKMELFSKDFKRKVTDMLLGSSKKAFVIGTIPQIHKVPQQHAVLFERLHADARIKILSVSRGNRDGLPEEIIRYFS